MNLGAESRKKLIAAVVLLGLALVLILRMLFSSGPVPVTATLAPTVMPATQPATRARPGTRNRPVRQRTLAAAPHSIDPSLRFDWLNASEGVQYEGTGRNIFLARAETPPTSAKPTPEDTAAEGPSGPPPPPPINLKFYGFASKPGEPRKVFLSQGEDVFIASEGEIVDRRYKVLHITPQSVEIEDVLNNNRQSIPLTQG